MNLDLVAWALKLLESVGPVREKIEQTWPHLKKISDEMMAILIIWNGGKGIALSSGPQTSAGSMLMSKLTGAGIPTEDAAEVVSTFEAFNARME